MRLWEWISCVLITVRSWFILTVKKVNEVLKDLITHLTFQSLQNTGSICIANEQPKDYFIKWPVFCQALLPNLLLEIHIAVMGGWICMSSSTTLTNESSKLKLQPMGARPQRQHYWCVDSSLFSEAVCTNTHCKPTVHQILLGKSIYTWPTARNGRNILQSAGEYTHTEPKPYPSICEMPRK